jgi:hypothetical protein
VTEKPAFCSEVAQLKPAIPAPIMAILVACDILYNRACCQMMALFCGLDGNKNIRIKGVACNLSFSISICLIGMETIDLI